MSERKWYKDPVFKVALGISALSYVAGGAAMIKASQFEENPRSDNLSRAAKQIDPDQIYSDLEAQQAINSALEIVGDDGKLDNHLKALSATIAESANDFPDSYERLQITAVKDELKSASDESDEINGWSGLTGVLIGAGSFPLMAYGFTNLQHWLQTRDLRKAIKASK